MTATVWSAVNPRKALECSVDLAVVEAQYILDNEGLLMASAA